MVLVPGGHNSERPKFCLDSIAIFLRTSMRLDPAVRVRVCVCVRARARACVCVSVCVSAGDSRIAQMHLPRTLRAHARHCS